MKIEEQIRNFIHENFLIGRNGNGLRNDASFLNEGIIDSTGVLELVCFIEETYEIRVDDEEVIPENLDSVNNVVAYVNRKLANCE